MLAAGDGGKVTGGVGAKGALPQGGSDRRAAGGDGSAAGGEGSAARSEGSAAGDDGSAAGGDGSAAGGAACVGEGSRRFTATPPWLAQSGSLHLYQLEGLNWLFHKWSSRESVILADEVSVGRMHDRMRGVPECVLLHKRSVCFLHKQSVCISGVYAFCGKRGWQHLDVQCARGFETNAWHRTGKPTPHVKCYVCQSGHSLAN